MIEDQGDDIIHRQEICVALMADFCGPPDAGFNALVAALRAGIPRELAGIPRELNSLNHVNFQGTRSRLAYRLSNTHCMRPEAAQWCVETWTYALGISNTYVLFPDLTSASLSDHTPHTSSDASPPDSTEEGDGSYAKNPSSEPIKASPSNSNSIGSKSHNTKPKNKNLVADKKLQKAAKNDNPNAQFELGMCYRSGRNGFIKSKKNAEIWIGKAAASGHEPAILVLEKMYREQGLEAEKILNRMQVYKNTTILNSSNIAKAKSRIPARIPASHTKKDAESPKPNLSPRQALGNGIDLAPSDPSGPSINIPPTPSVLAFDPDANAQSKGENKFWRLFGEFAFPIILATCSLSVYVFAVPDAVMDFLKLVIRKVLPWLPIFIK